MTLMETDTDTEDEAEQSVACRAADRASTECKVTRGVAVTADRHEPSGQRESPMTQFFSTKYLCGGPVAAAERPRRAWIFHHDTHRTNPFDLQINARR